MMRFDIITIFPEAFESYFTTSILARAQKKKCIDIHLHNLRTWTTDRHKTVDDKPYGGGAGMVLKVEPIVKAVETVSRASKQKRVKPRVILFSAKGKQFNQKRAYEWAKKGKHLILISGRYEGIDERVRTILRPEEISLGPYVLTDGDVAAMVVVSAVARLVPGVIKPESLTEESYRNLLVKEGGKKISHKGLEYPHYTRPEVFAYKGRSYRVPKVLLSGDHKRIAEWRRKHSLST